MFSAVMSVTSTSLSVTSIASPFEQSKRSAQIAELVALDAEIAGSRISKVEASLFLGRSREETPMIDFELSPEQRQLQLDARAFAKTHLTDLRKKMAGKDAAGRFDATKEVYEAAVKAGYLKLQVPPPLGGTMNSLVDVALVAEELIAVESSLPLSVLSTGLGIMGLLFFGNPDQYAKFLPPFVSGEGAPLAGLSFSEPQGTANYHNTDPSKGFQTSAVLEGDEWVINGRKIWTPHANGWGGKHADLLAVAARVGMDKAPQESLSMFLVPGSTPGITIEENIETIGQPGAEVCVVRYENVRVPKDRSCA
jgi:alkylation response protein AidB-like acyl-CoA dehydrogenase